MSTHRRTITIDLYPGEYEQQLAEALEAANDAVRREATSPRRFGQASPALAAAKAFDELRDHPPEPVARVTLWQIGYLDWDDLVALPEHEPRADNPSDALHGVNMSTFPRAVLHASLIDPDDARSITARVSAGEQRLRDLSPSRVHYTKLEAEAWAVNSEELNLPKDSLASLLTRARGDDSEQRN
jgi:hypothetical protein